MLVLDQPLLFERGRGIMQVCEPCERNEAINLSNKYKTWK